MTLPRWSIRRSAAGLWVVRCTTTRVTNRFASWHKAVAWTVKQISRFVVQEALPPRRAGPGRI